MSDKTLWLRASTNNDFEVYTKDDGFTDDHGTTIDSTALLFSGGGMTVAVEGDINELYAFAEDMRAAITDWCNKPTSTER